jgi:hypothetical protein
MMELTPDARRKFDEYLNRMRYSLHGQRAVEPVEVEQNVVEHVEAALATAPVPVGPDRLSEVLAQLGPPEQWMVEDERSMWRRTVDRFMTGPEDWRLAYLSLAMTFLMVVFLPVGGFLLIFPGYLLSRAYFELLSDRGEALGARKWLVLPPVAILMVLLSLGALLGPAGAIGGVLSEIGLREFGWTWDSRMERTRIFSGMVAIGTGVWWIILSGVFAMLMRPFRFLFLPLTTNLRRGHAIALTIAGVIVAGAGAVLLYAF